MFILDSNSVYMTKQKKNTRRKNSRRKPKKHTYLQPDFSKLDTFLLFIGYPRSGSTLIGSLLDAHPNIIIANEHNVITRWKNFTREQQTKEHVCTELYNNSVKESLKEQRAVFKKYFFHYHVPGLWQGRFDGQIKVGTSSFHKKIMLKMCCVDYFTSFETVEAKV